MDLTTRWLSPDDWDLLRKTRLRALSDAPEAFTSTGARESTLETEEWRARTGNAVVAFADGEPVGMAVFISDESKGQLVGMWVAPEARGSGAAAALVDQVAGRAATAGFPLWLCVYADNPRAKRFYERYGFVPTGERCDVTGARTMIEMELPGS